MFANPFKKLRVGELGYIAGLIDGEGSVSVEQPQTARCARVVISNTSQVLMEWLRNKLPEGKIYCTKKRKDTWKDAYTFRLNGVQAYHLLRVVYPYLIIKKEQAGRIINEYQVAHNIDKLVEWQRYSGGFRKALAQRKLSEDARDNSSSGLFSSNKG